MCYTGEGRLETGMGECLVKNYDEFKKEMVIDACTVCRGYPFETKGLENEYDFYTDEEFDTLAETANSKRLLKVW